MLSNYSHQLNRDTVSVSGSLDQFLCSYSLSQPELPECKALLCFFSDKADCQTNKNYSFLRRVVELQGKIAKKYNNELQFLTRKVEYQITTYNLRVVSPSISQERVGLEDAQKYPNKYPSTRFFFQCGRSRRTLKNFKVCGSVGGRPTLLKRGKKSAATSFLLPRRKQTIWKSRGETI